MGVIIISKEKVKKNTVTIHVSNVIFIISEGEIWLRDKFWFCNGDQLELPLEDGSSSESIVDR